MIQKLVFPTDLSQKLIIIIFYCNSIYYGIFVFDVSGWVVTKRKYLMKVKSYFWIFVLFAETEKKRGNIIMASIEGVDGSLKR